MYVLLYLMLLCVQLFQVRAHTFDLLAEGPHGHQYCRLLALSLRDWHSPLFISQLGHEVSENVK